MEQRTVNGLIYTHAVSTKSSTPFVSISAPVVGPKTCEVFKVHTEQQYWWPRTLQGLLSPDWWRHLDAQRLCLRMILVHFWDCRHQIDDIIPMGRGCAIEWYLHISGTVVTRLTTSFRRAESVPCRNILVHCWDCCHQNYWQHSDGQRLCHIEWCLYIVGKGVTRLMATFRSVEAVTFRKILVHCRDCCRQIDGSIQLGLPIEPPFLCIYMIIMMHFVFDLQSWDVSMVHVLLHCMSGLHWLFRDVCMLACALLLTLGRLVYACFMYWFWCPFLFWIVKCFEPVKLD